MPGEVGAALTGQRFGNFRKEPNIEDRRDEHGFWKNLMMSLGAEPIDKTDPGLMGLEPGAYHTQDLDPRDAKSTPLGEQLGYSAIKEQPLQTMEQLLKRIETNGP